MSLDTTGGALIRNVTIHSAVQPAFLGDVLVLDGDISKIGSGLEAPAGAVVIDGSGKHLAPGAIDTHSHMAIERGINEGTLSITADCDITDVINADIMTIGANGAVNWDLAKLQKMTDDYTAKFNSDQ